MKALESSTLNLKPEILKYMVQSFRFGAQNPARSSTGDFISTILQNNFRPRTPNPSNPQPEMSEEDRQKCQSAVRDFLNSDLTLRKWKADSGCSQLPGQRLGFGV